MICPHCQKNTELLYYQGGGYHPAVLEEMLANKINILDQLARDGAYDAEVPASVRLPLELRYQHLLRDCNELEVVLGL